MDNDTERLIRDNARVEHALLSPFRWLENIFKFGCFMLFCVICLGSNATWWMVGCGSMGWRDRQERAIAFVKDTDEPGKSSVASYDIVLGDRADPVSTKDARFYKENPWELGDADLEGFPHYAPASGVSVKATMVPVLGSNFNDNDANAKPVSFCSENASDQEPGMGLPEGWFDRSRSIFGRKSSRMYEAYVTGAVAITALRVTLTEIKLGRHPLIDLSAEPGQVKSLCHVDPFDVLTEPEAEAKRWDRTSKGIDLRDAPWIHMRTVLAEWEDVNPHSWDTDPEGDKEPHRYKQWIISGMCLEEECVTFPARSESYHALHFEGVDPGYVLRDDLNFSVSDYADLFDPTPPLSAHQTHALEALNHLATDDFWITEAHKNGIYDDATVKAMAASTTVL